MDNFKVNHHTCLKPHKPKKHSPFAGANTSSSAYKLPLVLCNPKVHHRTPNIPPLAPTLSQPNPVKTNPSTSSSLIWWPKWTLKREHGSSSFSRNSTVLHFSLNIPLFLLFPSYFFLTLKHITRGRSNSVGTATFYGWTVRGNESRWRPDIPHLFRHPWSPLSLLYSGYMVSFPRVKAVGACR